MDFSISTKALDPAKLSSSIKTDAAGGFVSFEGWVRNSNEGLPVTALEYEIFQDLALTEGQKILWEAKEKFSIIDAKAVHREGTLAIGDCAVWIGVASRHRSEAFAACRYIIDEIKHRLPVWKKEHYVGNEPQWVNCQHLHHVPATDEKEFYSRQTILDEIGPSGQEKLKSARVLIVGAGGLGSAAALALAGAGIGTIGIADHDQLSLSNLHRQILYSTDDVGKPKASLAAARIESLNPFIKVKAYVERITGRNVEVLFNDYDAILDCTDNFTAKYLLNDASVLFAKPLIQASIYRFEGQLLTIDIKNDAGCLRCLFPDPPLPGMIGDCASVGVLGTVPMTFGVLQANETIKRILGLETSSNLLNIDLLSMTTLNIKRNRRKNCALCGLTPTIKDLPAELDYLASIEDTEAALKARFTLIDVREAQEMEAQPLEKALHIPTSSFDISLLKVPKETPLLIVCAHGVRSRTAAEYIYKAGWKNTYSLSGGLTKLRSKA